MSELDQTQVAYRAAKAIQSGQKLWCMWATKEPYARGVDKTGFVLERPEDMRRMAADLFRLADSIEELDVMWKGKNDNLF